jgi:hypothetical protein
VLGAVVATNDRSVLALLWLWRCGVRVSHVDAPRTSSADRSAGTFGRALLHLAVRYSMGGYSAEEARDACATPCSPCRRMGVRVLGLERHTTESDEWALFANRWFT